MLLEHFYTALASTNWEDWLSVANYLLAATLTGRAARAARRANLPRERRFWQRATALLLFFAFNELFDLQTLLTLYGRELAKGQGWYEARRTWQGLFIKGLVACAIVTLAAVALRMRRSDRSTRWAVFGFVFVAAFVVLRAASFHHADLILGWSVSFLSVGFVQEIIGPIVIAAAAWSYQQRRRITRVSRPRSVRR